MKTRFAITASPLVAALLTLAAATLADHIPGLYNTGVKDDTSLRTSEDLWESHYTVTPPLGGICALSVLDGVNDCYLYNLNGTHSRPIGCHANQCLPSTGVFALRTSFDMTGLNTNSARLRGLWLSRGPGVMLLNNLPVASYNYDVRYEGVKPFEVTEGFVDGTNFLDFFVTNGLILQVDALQGTALPPGSGYRSIPDLRDTGTLPEGALAPAYASDSAYRLVAAPAGVSLGPALVMWMPSCSPAPPGCDGTCGWYKNGPYAQWIARSADSCNLSSASGVYLYQHSFNMTGLVPATGKIDGWCASAASGLMQIRLNGVVATNIPAIGSRRTYFAVTNGFVAGMNNLEFILTSSGSDPAALFVEGLQGSAMIDTNAPVLSIRVSQVELAWDSATNVTYQVQTRSALTTGEWVNYGDPVVGMDGVVRVQVPVDRAHSFYRLIIVP
jgi:hypothetical protein